MQREHYLKYNREGSFSLADFHLTLNSSDVKFLISQDHCLGTCNLLDGLSITSSESEREVSKET